MPCCRSTSGRLPATSARPPVLIRDRPRWPRTAGGSLILLPSLVPAPQGWQGQADGVAAPHPEYPLAVSFGPVAHVAAAVKA